MLTCLGAGSLEQAGGEGALTVVQRDLRGAPATVGRIVGAGELVPLGSRPDPSGRWSPRRHTSRARRLRQRHGLVGGCPPGPMRVEPGPRLQVSQRREVRRTIHSRWLAISAAARAAVTGSRAAHTILTGAESTTTLRSWRRSRQTAAGVPFQKSMLATAARSSRSISSSGPTSRHRVSIRSLATWGLPTERLDGGGGQVQGPVVGVGCSSGLTWISSSALRIRPARILPTATFWRSIRTASLSIPHSCAVRNPDALPPRWRRVCSRRATGGLSPSPPA